MTTSNGNKFIKWFKGFFGLNKYEESDMNWFLYALVLLHWPFHWLVCFWSIFCFLISYAPIALLDALLDFLINKAKEKKGLLWLRKVCRIVKVEITSVLNAVDAIK